MHRVFLMSTVKQTRLLMLHGHSSGSNFGHNHFASPSHCEPGRPGIKYGCYANKFFQGGGVVAFLTSFYLNYV